MVALLKLLLSGVATENGVAVLVNAVAKVLTGHANTGSFPALKLPFVDEIPLLHNPMHVIHMYYYGWYELGKRPYQFGFLDRLSAAFLWTVIAFKGKRSTCPHAFSGWGQSL